MEAIRTKYYRVCYITIADTVKTIFETTDHKEAERFALAYDGGEVEIFIKPVYKLNGIRQRQGSEL